MNGRKHEWMEVGWMDRWMDGWMDGRMDRWMDGRIEGWIAELKG